MGRLGRPFSFVYMVLAPMVVGVEFLSMMPIFVS
jgi:hypothetical protein